MPMSAEYQAELIERRERPFRFEDIELNSNGKRIEPEDWGPIYSKPPKPGKVVRREPPTNAPSGQPYEFSAAKHRAKLKAEFTTLANAEKRAWANGLPRKGAFGKLETIADAYAAAPKYKPRKPHYILREGEWRLAA